MDGLKIKHTMLNIVYIWKMDLATALFLFPLNSFTGFFLIHEGQTATHNFLCEISREFIILYLWYYD